MADAQDRLIGALAADLRPVRRLRPPALRAALFLGVVAAAALGFSAVVPLGPIAARLAGADDMWLSVAGSALTTIAATIAAFQASVPGRDPRWAWLPLPPALLWLGASGLGCLRAFLVPDAHVASMGETMHCLRFIVLMSLPLSALLLFMLRRAHPLRPALVAGLGGLAAAAAAASLLWFVHPFDASATDLAVHVAAVLAVIGLTQVFGGRALAAR
jgi:hypothetical protein